MQGLSHTAFSLSSTSVLCAFFDINVFESIDYIGVIVLASQLPDIDHPRSFFGYIFKPISNLISRLFGHRTITHSLLAVAIVSVLCVPFNAIFFDHFSLLFVLSYSMHLFLDMMTLQGVPLLYPFNSIYCVLPGSPQYRLTTGLPSHELLVVAFSLFSFLFLQDFIKDGFWTSYNKAFSTVEHLCRESRNNDKLLSVSIVVKNGSSQYVVDGLLVDCLGDNKVAILTLDDHDVYSSILQVPAPFESVQSVTFSNSPYSYLFAPNSSSFESSICVAYNDYFLHIY